MKILLKSTVFFLYSCMLIFIISCQSEISGKMNPDESYQNLINKWQVVELNGEPVADRINDHLPYIQFDGESSRFNADMGCNMISGTFTAEDSQVITFSKALSTLKACDQMHVESAFVQILDDVKSYEIDDKFLSFYNDDKDVVAKFHILQQSNSSIKLEGKWTVEYIAGLSTPLSELGLLKTPIISFNQMDKKVSGNTSCNSFSAAYTQDGNNLQFGDLGMTRMFCENSVETEFVNAIKSVTKFDILEDTLYLIADDIVVMKLEKN